MYEFGSFVVFARLKARFGEALSHSSIVDLSIHA